MRGSKARALRKKHGVKHVRLAKLDKPNFDHLPILTYWNGERAPARKVTAIVAEPPKGVFPSYWARQFIGQRRKAVEIDYFESSLSYIDDEDGQGWYKVTDGRGSLHIRHADLIIDPDSVEAR